MRLRSIVVGAVLLATGCAPANLRLGLAHDASHGTRAASGDTLTETVLYNFQNFPDGAIPESTLVADASGALYGTTQGGGNNYASCHYFFGCGVVFKLTPVNGITFTESVLYRFTNGSDGSYPYGLTIDASGNLYGATVFGGSPACSCGTVFRLAPGAHNTYAFTLLHAFSGEPDGYGRGGGLVLDATGAVYGSTYEGGPANLGTVYKITPEKKSSTLT